MISLGNSLFSHAETAPDPEFYLRFHHLLEYAYFHLEDDADKIKRRIKIAFLWQLLRKFPERFDLELITNQVNLNYRVRVPLTLLAGGKDNYWKKVLSHLDSAIISIADRIAHYTELAGDLGHDNLANKQVIDDLTKYNIEHLGIVQILEAGGGGIISKYHPIIARQMVYLKQAFEDYVRAREKRRDAYGK